MSLFNAVYVFCRGRAVTNVGKTCGPTPCLMLAINTFKHASYGYEKKMSNNHATGSLNL